METSGELPPRGRGRAALAAVALALVTLAAWGRVPGGAFQYDDYASIVRDEATSDARALAASLRSGLRPILSISYFLDHALWGMRAGGFLATNLALLVVAVLLVHALARRRLESALGAFAAAAVFAVQPAHAEVVAYVSGRSTGLMTVLLLGALICHDKARDRQGRARRALVVASLALFALAALTKEVALVYPLLLLAWEGTRPPGGAGDANETARQLSPPRSAAVAALAVATPAALALLLALSPRYRELGEFSLALRGPVETLAINTRVVPAMLSLWVRPWGLSVEHPAPASGAPFSLPGALLLVVMPAAAVALRRTAPHLALALGWVFVALLPTNSVIAKLDPMTEKPLHLAWFGPALLCGALLAHAAPGRRTAGTAILAMVTVWGVFWCNRLVTVWSDPRLLWADALTKAPSSSRAWNNLGMGFLVFDNTRRAEASFRRALALDPGNVQARANLARARLIGGNG